MRGYIFLLLLFFLFLGCESNSQKIEILEQEKRKIEFANKILEKNSFIKSTELESQKEIEKIKMQKEIEIEKIKAETKINEISTKKEIALKEIELKKSELEHIKNREAWKIVLFIISFILFLYFIYRLFKEYQNSKIDLQKQKLAHEAKMHEKELQAKVLVKMLDAIKEGKLTPEQHEALLKNFSGRKITHR